MIKSNIMEWTHSELVFKANYNCINIWSHRNKHQLNSKFDFNFFKSKYQIGTDVNFGVACLRWCKCCIFWPAFGCSALQKLVEKFFFIIFCTKKMDKGRKFDLGVEFLIFFWIRVRNLPWRVGELSVTRIDGCIMSNK